MNTRDTAYRGTEVRLECSFKRNGQYTNPYAIGDVQIRNEEGVYATLTPQQEGIGRYYVVWPIPSGQPLGYTADVWSGIQLYSTDEPDNTVFRFLVMANPSEGFDTYQPPANYSGLCKVYEYWREGNGAPLDDVEVIATVESFGMGNEIADFPMQQDTYTNANGRAEFWLPQGATVQVRVPFTGYSVVKLIEGQTEERLSDLEDGN